MRTATCSSLFVLALCAAAGEAQAEITASWQPVPITPAAVASDPALANTQTWDLMVTTTGNWASAALRARLPSGSVYYHHPLGRDTAPAPDVVAANPAVAFDTFLSSPADPSPPPSILGGYSDLGDRTDPFSMGGASDFSPGFLTASWGELVIDPPGTYRILRVTFPLGVLPDVSATSGTSQVDPADFVTIPDIPEPAATAFAAVIAAGLLFLRRRTTSLENLCDT